MNKVRSEASGTFLHGIQMKTGLMPKMQYENKTVLFALNYGPTTGFSRKKLKNAYRAPVKEITVVDLT